MEEETKVAKKKTWWDKTDILEAFLDVAHDESSWAADVCAREIGTEYVESLGEIAGAAKLVNKLLEATDAD